MPRPLERVVAQRGDLRPVEAERSRASPRAVADAEARRNLTVASAHDQLLSKNLSEGGRP